VQDGIVYDVPGCELGHHGEDVSFDSILKKYNLAEPVSARGLTDAEILDREFIVYDALYATCKIAAPQLPSPRSDGVIEE
jgi:hypothetical protein